MFDILIFCLELTGNFTRVKSIVQRLCRIRADEAIILLLSHHNPDVAVAAAGVLVNITGFTLFFDDEVRDNFAAETYGAVKISALALTSILRKSSVSDLLFLTLVLQVGLGHDLTVSCSFASLLKLLLCFLGVLQLLDKYQGSEKGKDSCYIRRHDRRVGRCNWCRK